MRRNYTRWTERDDRGGLTADILGAPYQLEIDPRIAIVHLVIPDEDGVRLDPDEARLLGVRLIEGAALADDERAIRRGPGS